VVKYKKGQEWLTTRAHDGLGRDLRGSKNYVDYIDMSTSGG
jgi:hypothetical protein